VQQLMPLSLLSNGKFVAMVRKEYELSACGCFA
jgi:hypothetical protein